MGQNFARAENNINNNKGLLMSFSTLLVISRRFLEVSSQARQMQRIQIHLEADAALERQKELFNNGLIQQSFLILGFLLS